MTVHVWCPRCLNATPHTSDGEQIVCSACGHDRPDDVPLLISHVQEMEFCPWCRQTLPVDHHWVEDLTTHGSPSDLDHPA